MIRTIRRYRNSIAKALFSSYFLLTIFAIIIMAVLSYFFFYNILENKSVRYNELTILSIYDRMESQLKEFDQITFQIYLTEVLAQVNDLNKTEYNLSGWEKAC